MRDKILLAVTDWLAGLSSSKGAAVLAEELTDEIMAVIEAGPSSPDGHCLKSAYEDFHS
jgi:hypothetical protein